MNKLTTAVPTLESREVATMVGKEHNDLMKDIRRYNGYLGVGDFPQSDFFIESTYINSQNKEQPCFLLTKKGCELVGNKMTGAKGIQFTAAYVQKFNEMETQQPQLDGLSPQLQLLINMELKQKELELKVIATDNKLESIKEVVALSHTNWRTDSTRIINKIATKLGGNEHISELRTESYKLLNERIGVNLKQRLANKRIKMEENGASESKCKKANYLDVIADDKKLINGYILIIKELAIKYGVEMEEA